MSNAIAASGHPLAFRAKPGTRPSLLGTGTGRATYKVETRMLSGHQKEAVVEEGSGGESWRLTSDEGLHLKGNDEAPPPLAFFNVGIMGDVISRATALAADKGITLRNIETLLKNYYWFQGSFAKGTGVGQADPSEFRVDGIPAEARDILDTAMRASPAIHALKAVIPATFALYVNGQRKPLSTITASDAPDANDPYLVHARAPEPPADHSFDPMTKPGVVQDGERDPFPDTIDGRLLRRVAGKARIGPEGAVAADSWIDLPGMSHFYMTADDRAEGNIAPSALTYLASGVSFCFMTQLSRYMGAMKLDSGHLRMVQNWDFEVDAGGNGIAHTIETHLFLNGAADAETHEMLVRVAAHTCYLHAALKTELPPKMEVG